MDPVRSDFTETLAAAQRAEDWAVGRLWRDLNPRLLRFLRTRHREAADDIASETWIRVSRSIKRFAGSEMEFRAWFFTIARAASIDWYRREARRPQFEFVSDATVLETRAAADDPAEGAMEAIDTDAALALISRLPADQAEVVLLRVVAGLDAACVGRVLGKRPGTVRVLQHRGLRRLAELLESDQPQRRDVTR
jgi:RNA polymerase sigma-70 factor (ECF subfamily)